MTSKESKHLKVGDPVVFGDGVNGNVVSVGNAGVRMKWDDGQEGVIHHDDMRQVSRREGKMVTVGGRPINTKTKLWTLNQHKLPVESDS